MKKLDKKSKIAIAIAGVILIAVGLAVRAYDKYDWDTHMQYAERNNCTWEWNQYGDWTICR